MDLIEKTVNSNRHPWELSRCSYLFKILAKRNLQDFADIGAGDRFFTAQLINIASGTVYAVDSAYPEQDSFIDGIVCLNDISKLPVINGGAILMDVLEHVEDDFTFLNDILKKLPENGTLLITVPAIQFLFSAYDAFYKHYRRYSRKQLIALLNRSDIVIEKCHYFYGSLFFFRLISLLAKPLLEQKAIRNQIGLATWSFTEKNVITRFIRFFLNLDLSFCVLLSHLHIYIPGLSLLAVCRKKITK
jgi:hypothetical protein